MEEIIFSRQLSAEFPIANGAARIIFTGRCYVTVPEGGKPNDGNHSVVTEVWSYEAYDGTGKTGLPPLLLGQLLIALSDTIENQFKTVLMKEWLSKGRPVEHRWKINA